MFNDVLRGETENMNVWRKGVIGYWGWVGGRVAWGWGISWNLYWWRGVYNVQPSVTPGTSRGLRL